MRNSSTGILWLIVLAALVVFVLRQSFRREEGVTPQPLPPLMAEGWVNAAGPPSNDELRGKLVVLDAWATWCPPCRDALPDLIEFHRQMGDRVTLIGLTPESGAEATTVREFAASREGMNWPIGYGADPTLEMLDLPGYPTYFLFDRKGMLVWQGHHVRALEEQVVKALGQ